MDNKNSNSLESIIRAAREMAQRRNHERKHQPSESETIHTTPTSFPIETETAHLSAADTEEASAVSISSPEENSCEKTISDDDTSLNNMNSVNSDDEISSNDGTNETVIQDVTEETTDTPLDFSNTEALLTAVKTFSETLETTSIHFLEFSVAFLSMVKRHYQQDGGNIRANSMAFFALIALDSWADDNYTMSDLAEKLQIPKQQLTKLINDLETRGLVERSHDTENRRRVYIRICEEGRHLMDQVKQDMLESTLYGLRSYTSDELLEMDQCICRLTELMQKFNTEP